MNRLFVGLARKGSAYTINAKINAVSDLLPRLPDLGSTAFRRLMHSCASSQAGARTSTCQGKDMGKLIQTNPWQQFDRLQSLRTMSVCGLGFPSSCSRPRSFHTSTAPLAQDYYDTLGVSRAASDNEIKKSYYKLAKKYHPDANPGDTEAVKRFQEVQEAYDILRDPQKRAMYDQVGHQQFQAGGGGGGAQGFQGGFPGGFPFGRGGFSGGGFAGQDMDDVLQNMAKEFFGRQGGFGGMYSSYQATTSVTISFMESLTGTNKSLTMDVGDGTGGKSVDVDVPPGVEHGQQLLMQDVVRTATSRVSLVVQIQVQPHQVFTRKGIDIWSKLELKLSEAILGCLKTVETAWGKKEIQVPQGTRPGAKIAIPNMGAPRLQGQGRGKHVLEVSLRFPPRLSKDQLQTIQQLQRLGL